MSRLIDPLKIGRLNLRNRIVMPPMATEYATQDGEATEKHVQHYSRRCKGLGLLIVEHTFVTPEGRLSRHQLGIQFDALIPKLRRVVEAVHEQNTPIALQITHAGGATTREVTGVQPQAPSAVVGPRGGEVPRELRKEEIEAISGAFAEAAQRAEEAGFDAVEIHGAHGFLLNQFLSPLTNRRIDEYGGTIQNRLRFSLDIISRIRDALGSDYPLLYRLGAEDGVQGGLLLEDGVRAAEILSRAGVSIIDVSGGLGGSRPSDLVGPGLFVPQAAAVRKAVDVPVIGVGGITTPEEADSIVLSGKVDLVAVGRAMLKDPDWAAKAVNRLKKSK
jgi:2,4-dienoyl-CoA reductase-like NADH-dependent reductase (Old Yellow Enzyme family)